MKYFILMLLLILIINPFYASTEFRVFNTAYAYNGENAAYWEETRTTITYFENLIQPYFVFAFNSNTILKAGVGLLLPFNQEEKVLSYYPYVQSKFLFDEYTLILGSLEGNHNFPPPMMDPLVNMTPQIRVLSKSQVPIPYEHYKNGLFSHGYYEYGIQMKYRGLLDDGIARWPRLLAQPNGQRPEGELYMNWQLPDTPDHRERFDVGLTGSLDPFYGSFHYWHNGGHENPHPVSITENYTAGIGLRNQTYSLLYLYSYFLPDRDEKPELNTTGNALFLEYNFDVNHFILQPQFFISDKYINTNHQYISIEGDPFYRVPLYAGFNVFRTWDIDSRVKIKIGFVNGVFLPYVDSSFEWKMIRYDQTIKADMEYSFDIEH